jgi:3-hydroxyacyl-CoA dehydrogenase
MMMAVEQDWYELNMAIAMFQQTSMKLRYSAIPVIAAPFGMTLGGGCEFSMHSDKIVAAAETYIGLVEVGVGLIPGGGGTKEFALRALKGTLPDDVKTNHLRNYFMNIATAKVATSAWEAKQMGILTDKDIIVVNKDRQIAEAKRQAIVLDELGYTPPIPESKSSRKRSNGNVLRRNRPNGCRWLRIGTRQKIANKSVM